MVISFSDSMQLTFAHVTACIAGSGQIHRLQERGAGGGACLRVLPTAPPGFVHCAAILRFRTDSGNSARPAYAATIIALIAVLSLVPAFGVLLVRNEKVFAVKFRAPTPAFRRCVISSATGIAVRMCQPSRAVQPERGAFGGRSRLHLRHAGAALSASRQVPGQTPGRWRRRAGSMPSSTGAIRSTC